VCYDPDDCSGLILRLGLRDPLKQAMKSSLEAVAVRRVARTVKESQLHAPAPHGAVERKRRVEVWLAAPPAHEYEIAPENRCADRQAASMSIKLSAKPLHSVAVLARHLIHMPCHPRRTGTDAKVGAVACSGSGSDAKSTYTSRRHPEWLATS
jgi:hypothetical protein